MMMMLTQLSKRLVQYGNINRNFVMKRFIIATSTGTSTSTSTSLQQSTKERTTNNNKRFLHSTRKTKNNADRSKIEGPYGKYQQEYNSSITNPIEFWYEASKDLFWHKPPNPNSILTQQQQQQQQHPITNNSELSQWFDGGQINLSYNCLDRHILDNRGSQTALIYDSPLTGGTKQTFTYEVLLNLVSRFASVLQNEFGVTRGDRVVIYMPLIPQAVVAMLACTRIGAIHSVVFGGFASGELASRIQDCDPKVVISANGGMEPGGRSVDYKKLLDDALDLVNKDKTTKQEDIKCVIVRRIAVNGGECEMTPGRDVCYDSVMSKTHEGIEAVPLPSTHPSYILYTSGTTGKPKGILRDTGSYATALKYSMSAFYNTKPGDTFWAASDIGWVVGHSYIVYGPLLHGCSTILYEGKPVGTPDAGAFWRVIEEYNVKAMFTAPTAFRVIKQADPQAELVEEYDLSELGTIFLAGERSDPDTIKYCEDALKEYDVPVIDHWWQTELGWPAIGNSIGLGKIKTKYGACAAPVPGFQLKVLNDDGHETEELGNLAIQLPLPPGALTSLYQNDERFISEYLTKYPGYYDTGDAGLIDSEGYVHVMGRTDDVINTAGHRLSTGALEEILLHHPKVAECAVIGVNDDTKGQIPVGFVTTVTGTSIDENALCAELIQSVRIKLGPVASFKKVAVVAQLPKTRSGKLLRATMVKIANGDEYTITPTIEDPNVFVKLQPAIENLVNS